MQDIEPLQAYARGTLGLADGIAEEALPVSGHNWGGVQIRGASLAFTVDGRVAFELPLPDVCTAQQAKVGAGAGGWCMGTGGAAGV